MRIIVLLLSTVLVSACGGVQYKDSNRAVDANPLCTSRPDRPGEPVAAGCERKAEGVWSLEESSDRDPIDFSGKQE